MGDQKRSDWPAWVRIALWGVPTRTAAWAYAWFAIAIALGSVAYGYFADRRFLGGAVLLLAALWYVLAIRWVDRRGGWGNPS